MSNIDIYPPATLDTTTNYIRVETPFYVRDLGHGILIMPISREDNVYIPRNHLISQVRQVPYGSVIGDPIEEVLQIQKNSSSILITPKSIDRYIGIESLLNSIPTTTDDDGNDKVVQSKIIDEPCESTSNTEEDNSFSSTLLPDRDIELEIDQYERDISSSLSDDLSEDESVSTIPKINLCQQIMKVRGVKRRSDGSIRKAGETCGMPIKSKGMCGSHYNLMKKNTCKSEKTTVPSQTSTVCSSVMISTGKQRRPDGSIRKIGERCGLPVYRNGMCKNHHRVSGRHESFGKLNRLPPHREALREANARLKAYVIGRTREPRCKDINMSTGEPCTGAAYYNGRCRNHHVYHLRKSSTIVDKK